MFQINEDLSIYATRGDIVYFDVSAKNTVNGETYKFQSGDVVRIKVFGKKDCETIVLQKDFPVGAESETVEIFLTKEDTKIGGVISKHKDYWYEVELNPESNPQTIIGYDDDGAKMFRLFPEGRDLTENDPVIIPEDIPIVDTELDLTSKRPVENRAVARAVERLKGSIVKTNEEVTKNADNLSSEIVKTNNALAVERARITNLAKLSEGSTTGDAELVDARIGYDGVTHENTGSAIREQIKTCLDNMRYLKDNMFNLFTRSECDDGYFYNYLGVRTAFATVYTTKLIDISGVESLTFYVDCTNYGSHSLTYWDENGEYISYLSVSTDIFKVSAFPDGAKYIRLAVYKGEATPRILTPFTFAEAEALGEKITELERSIGTMAGKKYGSFSILGDSYSTFAGFTTPTGNAQYYPSSLVSDVKSVRDTWWHKFATATGMALSVNNSYSGSRIATGKGDGQSFIDRANNIGNPELIIVLGATNDIVSEMGEYKYSNWTNEDLICFRPALSYLLNYLAEHNAGAKVVFVLNNGLGNTLTDSVREICEYHGVDLLELVDIDKENGHPTELGMTQIKDQLITFLGE